MPSLQLLSFLIVLQLHFHGNPAFPVHSLKFVYSRTYSDPRVLRKLHEEGGLLHIQRRAFPLSPCITMKLREGEGSTHVQRSTFLGMIKSATLLFISSPKRALARCKDIDSCREEGDERLAQQQLEAGPRVSLGKGVQYRETRRGTGEQTLVQGDAAEITFMVMTTGGNYMYSLGRDIEPGQHDLGETLRITLGKHDVPIAVEMALEGMRKGAIRRVEMPPNLGFETSSGEPAPKTFSGKKKMERYSKLLTGNGLQPGYDAELIFEVELVKIRKAS